MPQKQIVIVQTVKSPGTAALLGCLFGPLGLLYVTPKGAIIMFVVNVLTGIFTLGFGLFLTWPICGIWGYKAAKSHNTKLLGGAAST